MNDIKLINLSSYVRPEVVELKTRGYVMNGRDNGFYQYMRWRTKPLMRL